MDKKQTQARRRQEDTALNRALLWVGAAIVLELLLVLVNRHYIYYNVSAVDLAILLRQVLKIVRIGGLVLGVVCLVFSVHRFRQGGKAALLMALAVGCGALVICAHVALAFQESGLRLLFLLVPAWAGLALVYYLYHKEFFLAAAGVGMSILGLWFIRYGAGAVRETALAFIGIVLVAAAALWLKKHDGMVSRQDGTQVRLMSKSTSYVTILASCLAGLAAVAAGLVLGSTAAYYLIFVMIAWLFALLVYYTVKLM